MTSYFCIIHMPGAPYREIAVIAATDDEAARRETLRLAAQWPGFETVALYEGERSVLVLANPALGFAVEPLDGLDRAA